MTRLSLPAADGSLPSNPVQWWYWTGQLTAAGGRRFGVEACFFVFTDETLLPQRVRDDLRGRRWWWQKLLGLLLDRRGFQMAHCAVSDVSGNRYLHSPLFKLGVPRVESDQYSLALDFPPGHRADANGGGGHDHVTLTLPAWSLDLKMVSDDAAVPPALHYDGRLHDYACGGYTYYYSRPRMAATGTLTLDGTALEVSGTMWFDRQYGDLNAVVHRGWQWFAMGLNDGRSIMLFDILDLPGETYGAVMQGASYRALSGADFSVAVLAHWTSPVTGIVYPSLWHVTIDGVVYVVTPLVVDQEFREPPPFETYWGGTCDIASPAGQSIGQAYVELNGFKRPVSASAGSL